MAARVHQQNYKQCPEEGKIDIPPQHRHFQRMIDSARYQIASQARRLVPEQPLLTAQYRSFLLPCERRRWHYPCRQVTRVCSSLASASNWCFSCELVCVLSRTRQGAERWRLHTFNSRESTDKMTVMPFLTCSLRGMRARYGWVSKQRSNRNPNPTCLPLCDTTSIETASTSTWFWRQSKQST